MRGIGVIGHGRAQGLLFRLRAISIIGNGEQQTRCRVCRTGRAVQHRASASTNTVTHHDAMQNYITRCRIGRVIKLGLRQRESDTIIEGDGHVGQHRHVIRGDHVKHATGIINHHAVGQFQGHSGIRVPVHVDDAGIGGARPCFVIGHIKIVANNRTIKGIRGGNDRAHTGGDIVLKAPAGAEGKAGAFLQIHGPAVRCHALIHGHIRRDNDRPHGINQATVVGTGITIGQLQIGQRHGAAIVDVDQAGIACCGDHRQGFAFRFFESIEDQIKLDLVAQGLDIGRCLSRVHRRVFGELDLLTIANGQLTLGQGVDLAFLKFDGIAGATCLTGPHGNTVVAGIKGFSQRAGTTGVAGRHLPVGGFIPNAISVITIHGHDSNHCITRVIDFIDGCMGGGRNNQGATSKALL